VRTLHPGFTPQQIVCGAGSFFLPLPAGRGSQPIAMHTRVTCSCSVLIVSCRVVCHVCRVVCGCVGSDDILDMITRLLSPKVILTSTPTFGMYSFLAKVAAARVIDVPRKVPHRTTHALGRTRHTRHTDAFLFRERRTAAHIRSGRGRDRGLHQGECGAARVYPLA
jgi:hypothetical protein